VQPSALAGWGCWLRLRCIVRRLGLGRSVRNPLCLHWSSCLRPLRYLWCLLLQCWLWHSFDAAARSESSSSDAPHGLGRTPTVSFTAAGLRSLWHFSV
jgi:hypothetical protein